MGCRKFVLPSYGLILDRRSAIGVGVGVGVASQIFPLTHAVRANPATIGNWDVETDYFPYSFVALQVFHLFIHLIHLAFSNRYLLEVCQT